MTQKDLIGCYRFILVKFIVYDPSVLTYHGGLIFTVAPTCNVNCFHVSQVNSTNTSLCWKSLGLLLSLLNTQHCVR